MPLIVINGIERIGKSYYSGILNKYLKTKYGDDYQIRKFSFPSYTTKTGKKLAQLIKRYREDDLFNLNKNSHFRYRRLAGFFVENVKEYHHLMQMGQMEGNISLVSNYYHYSILAHGFASGVVYSALKHILEPLADSNSPPHLAFFLVTKNVRKMLTEPLKTHEVYLSGEELAPETYSEDYINYFTMVNNYYKQIFLAEAFKHKKKSTFHLVEIDPDSVNHISETVDKIKCGVESFFPVRSVPEKRS